MLSIRLITPAKSQPRRGYMFVARVLPGILRQIVAQRDTGKLKSDAPQVLARNIRIVIDARTACFNMVLFSGVGAL
jgi:hypothetical protein